MVFAELLARAGIEFHQTDRGGDVTFHGPGQVVGYPIFDLKRHRKDLHWYLRQVEEVRRAIPDTQVRRKSCRRTSISPASPRTRSIS